MIKLFQNTCPHSAQNLLFSCLLCKKVKIEIYARIILLSAFNGYETCSFTLSDENKTEVFQKRIFGPKLKEQKSGEFRIMRNSII